MNRKPLQVLTACVVGLAVGSASTLPADGLTTDATLLAVLALLAFLVGSQSVRLPGTGLRVTASDVFVFVALTGNAALGAPLIAATGTLGAVVLSGQRRSLLRGVFNVAAVSAAAAAASWLTVLAAPQEDASATLDRALVILFAALLYHAVNLALVALVVALEGSRGFLATVTSAGPRTLVSVLASALVALGLGSLSHVLGAAAPFLGLALVPLIGAHLRAGAPGEQPAVAAAASPRPALASVGRD